MKRIVIAVLCILFSAGMQAQIQTKFLGLELSKGYPTIERARDIIADRCERTEINGNLLFAYGVHFAGSKWESATISFYKINNTNVIDAVSFVKSDMRRKELKSLFNDYLEALTNKYGPSKKYASFYTWNSKDGKYSCGLLLTKCSITIMYHDMELLKMSKEIENSEL